MKSFIEWINEKKSQDKEIFEFGEKLLKKSKKNFNYDIPYLAGYNNEGTIFYIDRHIPEKWNYKGKEFNIHNFLLRHESVEKAAQIEFGYKYMSSHHIALEAERKMVEEAGINWNKYQNYCDKYIKLAENEKLQKVPPDLDLLPYKTFHDKKDIKLLKRIEEINGEK